MDRDAVAGFEIEDDGWITVYETSLHRQEIKEALAQIFDDFDLKEHLRSILRKLHEDDH